MYSSPLKPSSTEQSTNNLSGQVPSNLALRFIRPRYFFPSMMVVWAGLTMCSAAAHHPRDLMAIRFFQGIAESTTFVGTHYILGAVSKLMPTTSLIKHILTVKSEVVYRERTREEKRTFHEFWSSWDYVWWIFADCHSFRIERSWRAGRMEMAIHRMSHHPPFI